MLSRRSLVAGGSVLTICSARAAPARITVRGTELHYDGITLRCAIGRGGIRAGKREGDGATPIGVFPLREVLYRPDRQALPSTALPVRALSKLDGWCDDPADAKYNRLVPLPYPAHHEELWRRDRLYDVLAVIGFNDDPIVPGRGSAIFLHMASANWGVTDGCVALEPGALIQLLSACAPGDMLDISTA
jgi:L,D-peptidoglycan transpeptidase YkuD (ErfK/YbiS/YcfS/YnhG family)